MKVWWKCTQPQAIREVEELTLSEHIYRNVALPHLLTKWILCGEWVPSEWESKQKQ